MAKLLIRMGVGHCGWHENEALEIGAQLAACSTGSLPIGHHNHETATALRLLSNGLRIQAQADPSLE